MADIFRNFKKINIKFLFLIVAGVFLGLGIFVFVNSIIKTAVAAPVTVELLTGATQSSWVASNAPYRTANYDSIAQSIYLKSDLNAAGINGPAVITQVCFYSSATAGRSIANFRIKMKNTGATSLAAFDSTGLTTVYGPTTYSAPVMNTWKCHTLTSPFIWDGNSNLLVEGYRNDSGSSSSGGMYIRTTGAGRTYAGYCNNCTGCTTVGQDCYNPSTQGAFSSVLNIKLTYSLSPNTPVPSYPSNGFEGVPTYPIFRFGYSDPETDNCTMFNLQVSDDPSFSSTTINLVNYSTDGPWSSGSIINYYSDIELSPHTKYYWKIQVFDGYSWSAWSNGTANFTTESRSKKFNIMRSNGCSCESDDECYNGTCEGEEGNKICGYDSLSFIYKKSDGTSCVSSTECYSNNCTSQVCGGTTGPTFTSLTAPSDSSDNYCKCWLDASVPPQKQTGRNGSVAFSWMYQDPGNSMLKSYELKVSETNDINGATTTYQSRNVNIASGSQVDSVAVDVTSTYVFNDMLYNKTYYWWAKGCNASSSCTNWIAGPSFSTPQKHYPIVGITWANEKIISTEDTQFCTTADVNNPADPCYAACYKGSASPAVPGDPNKTGTEWICSACFADSANQYKACQDVSGTAYNWYFPDLAEGTDYVFVSSTNATSPNPVVKFLKSAKGTKIKLKVSGSSCGDETSTDVFLPNPIWKEKNPF